MSFFGPKVLLLLKRQSLEIYHQNSDNPLVVKFPQTAVRHLVIVNSDELVKVLLEGFKSANLSKQQAVLVLSDHIVFESLIPTENPDISQKQIAKFYHDIPLEETHIAKKIVPLKGSVLALAVNKEIIKTVIETAEEFEWKIKAVIPMTLFSKLGEGDQLSREQVNQILSADKSFKEANFMEESVLVGEAGLDGEKAGQSDTVDKSKTKLITTVLVVLFLISLIIGLLFFFKIISLPKNLPWANSQVESGNTLIPEASESAKTEIPESSSVPQVKESTVSAEDKENVRIHVLNGSEIAGQAGMLKAKLIDIGYTNVITGNIESSEASSSSIIYTSNLSESVRGEINELMDSLIGESLKTEELLNEFDIRITLGRLDQPLE